jgi:hypothetical protein
MPKKPDRRATYRKCKTPTLVKALQKAQGSPSGGSDIDTTLWRVTLDNPRVPNVTARVRGVTERAGVQCHKMRGGYFRLGGVQGVLRPLAPEKRKDVPKARSWCVCMCNAYWLRAHPRRHAVYGWKIRKGNFSFPVTALRTKSSYCTVTRQCASVNKSTQRRTRILSGIFQRETSSGRTNTYAFLTD